MQLRTNEVRAYMRREKLKAFVAVLALSAVSSLPAPAEDREQPGSWISAWSTAVHSPLPFPGLPPAQVFENQTVRMVVRTAIGGRQIRLRFSNACGTSPLEIGSAHVALTAHDAAIVAETDHAITFGGRPSVKIPPGAPILSDPVAINVPALAELSVSIYLPHSALASTMHFWAQHASYVSGPGDLSAKADISPASSPTSWYFISDVEVWAADRAAAVVALGDSITDGVGAKQGTYEDWPDRLAKRLSASAGGTRVAILNEGIGGNRILHDGAGVNALARFDRDVLDQPGVRGIILLEGINDIGWPHMKPPSSKDGSAPKVSPFAAQIVTADDLIAGYRQIIDRAHQHHIRVFAATMTPYEGADFFSADGEAVRQAVNQWIRTSGVFDGVFDFDAAVRDPAHPFQFRDSFHSGDHLHPSADGYKAMADAVDVALIKSAFQ
jgi:lysophospholipase L1-like esterase